MHFVKNLAVFALFIGLLILSCLLILCYIITLPYKLLVCLLAKLFRPYLGPLITNESAYFHYKTQNLAHITQFLVLQGSLPLKTLRNLVAERLTELRNPEGTLVFQRLREYPSEFLGFDFWKTDAKFSVSNHIRALDPGSLEGLCPGMAFNEKLEKLTSTVVGASSWKEDQSPWEMFPVYFPEEGKTVLAGRFHHILADGYSHRFIMECLLQCKFNHQPKTTPPTRIWDFSPGLLLFYPWRCVWDAAVTTYMLLNDPNILWHCKDFTDVDCLSAYSKPFRTEDIKRISKKHGVAYSTVVFSVFSNAFTRVMVEAQQKPPLYSSILYLGQKNNHPKVPTNHFYAHYMPLTNTSIENLNVEFLNSYRNLNSVWVDLFFGKITLTLPTPLKWLLRLFLSVDPTTVISTFPTFDDVSTFADLKILDGLSLLGIRPCRAGTNISVTGVFHQVRFTVVLSKSIAPDDMSAQRLVDYMWEELHKMVPKGNIELDKGTAFTKN